jgi:hypothetical protein
LLDGGQPLFLSMHGQLRGQSGIGSHAGPQLQGCQLVTALIPGSAAGSGARQQHASLGRQERSPLEQVLNALHNGTRG